MAMPPTPHVSRRTWLDRRAARLRRGSRAVHGAAIFTTIAAAFAACSLYAAAGCWALLAAYCAFVAIDAGLPWED